MKILTAVSTCALLALASPAWAQTTGSPSATGSSTMKQPVPDKNSGMTEGRSSVTEPNNDAGVPTNAAMKKNASPDNSNGNMAPGGGPGESGGK
jgi:hypothetical protein